MCDGAIYNNALSFTDMLTEGIFNPQVICNEVLKLCTSPHIFEISLQNVSDRILSDKPPLITKNDFVDNIYKKIAANPHKRKTVRNIHFTDIHIDMKY